MLRIALAMLATVLFCLVGACAHTSSPATPTAAPSTTASPDAPATTKSSGYWRFNGDIYGLCPAESVPLYRGNDKPWAGLFLMEDDRENGCWPPRVVLLSPFDDTPSTSPWYNWAVLVPRVTTKSGVQDFAYSVPDNMDRVFRSITIHNDGTASVDGTAIREKVRCDYVGHAHKLSDKRVRSAGVTGYLYSVDVLKDKFEFTDSAGCALFFSPDLPAAIPAVPPTPSAATPPPPASPTTQE